MSRASSIKAFRQAMDLLRKLDPEYQVYVGGFVAHLMNGPSHIGNGVPQRQNIVESDYDVRISGGDW